MRESVIPTRQVGKKTKKKKPEKKRGKGGTKGQGKRMRKI